MSEGDLSHWLTKREAAAVLGVAEKTVERLAARKEIQQATRKRAGMAPVVVFHPEDVGRIKAAKDAESKPAPFVVPEGGLQSQEAPERRALVHRAGASQFSIEDFFKLIEKGRRHDPVVPLNEKLYLTIREASLLAGLPETHIRASLKDGKLSGLKTGAGWRVKRADIIRVFDS